MESPELSQQPSRDELFKRIKPREPVLSVEQSNEFVGKRLEEQWLILTEIVRRNILTDKDLRQDMVKLMSEPVTESLPGRLYDLVKSRRLDERVSVFDQQLGKYLKIPPVPDSAVGENLIGTPPIRSKEEIEKEIVRKCGDDVAAIEREISKLDNVGVSRQETSLVLRRMRFAREVKLLALGSEVTDQNNFFTNDKEGKIVLPSGTKILICTKNSEQINELLDPASWRRKRQIKSRTHSIITNDSTYLLKERKTFKDNGLLPNNSGEKVEPNTSIEEANLAMKLNSVVQNDPDVEVVFENPLGVVEFPDGYSFVIYEPFTDMVKPEEATRTIKDWILSHRDQYQSMYQQAIKDVDTYIGDPLVWIDNEHETPEDYKEYADLSWEEFAEARANIISTKAYLQSDKVLSEAGYKQVDSATNNSWSVKYTEHGPRIVNLVYDLEYVKHIKKTSRSKLNIDERTKQQYNLEYFRGNPAQMAMYLSAVNGEMSDFFV